MLAEQFVENEAHDDDRNQELGRGKRMRFRPRTFLSSYPNLTDCQDHLHHRQIIPHSPQEVCMVP